MCCHTVISWLAGGLKVSLLVVAETAPATAATPSFGSKCVREGRYWCPYCSIANGETLRDTHKHRSMTARTQSTSTTRLSLYTCGRFVLSCDVVCVTFSALTHITHV